MADEKIINIDEMRNKIHQDLNQEDANQYNPIKELDESIQGILQSNDNDFLMDLAKIVALPDQQFALIAPLFLEEMEKRYQRPEEQVVMAQMFNAGGINIDDFIENFDILINNIEEQFGKDLTKEKVDFIKRLLSLTYNAVLETQTIDKRFVVIPYERCHENAQEPAYAHSTDAGMDIYALDDIIINPGETKIIPTGLKMEIPKGYAILVHPRSGTSNKTKLRVANSIGLIDSPYRGEIGVIIENIEPKIKDITVDEEGHITSIEYGKAYTIGKGERFAQLRVVEVPRAALMLVDKVNDTERAEGGFGSTGA